MSRMRFVRPATGCLILLSMTATCHSHGFEEDAFFEPLPIVLTASRLPQQLADAPGAITVIDRDTIDAANYRNIARLLRAVPGVNIGFERGVSSWVSYHGFGVSRPGMMQILVDGAAMSVPANFGAVGWSATPIFMSELEQIEVVRGASANSYGGTSLLGSANLITRAITDTPTTTVRSHLGDNSIRDLEVAWSGRIGNTGARFIAGEQHDAGYTGLADTRTTQRLSLSAETRIDAHNSFHLRLGSARERPERGYPDSPFGSNALRRANDRQSLIHLRWRHAQDTDREWSVSYFRQYHNFVDHWTTSYGPFVDVPIARDRRGSQTRIELQRRDRPSADTRVAWGVSSQRSEITSQSQFSTSSAIISREEKAFANVEWQANDAITLNAGMTAEEAGVGWRVSPRLHANLKTSAQTTWRLGASRVYRAPALVEKYNDVRIYDTTASGLLIAHPFVPNPDVRETRADTLEAGMLSRFDPLHITLDVRLFHERLKDQVERVYVSAPALLAAQIPSTQFRNADTATTLTGLELQANARPWRGGRLQLAWSLIDRDAGNRDTASAIAPYMLNLSWQQHWSPRWESYLSINRVGPVAMGDSYLASDRFVVDDYTSMDVSLSRAFSAYGHPARFSLTALNLGPRHQEIADPAMQIVYGNRAANRVSRQVYAGLTVQF